jgi:hypothetical protein
MEVKLNGNEQFVTEVSASARISKWQRYQGFLYVLGKGQGAALAKKGQFASYKLEKWTEFTNFRVNKMFSHKF